MPRQMRETLMPVRPKLTYSMLTSFARKWWKYKLLSLPQRCKSRKASESPATGFPLRSNKASEGEVVVLYFEPSATQNLKSSGFPDVLGRSPATAGRSPKGKQHGKIDPILGIHQRGCPRIGHFAVILAVIANHYLIFAMLFMQLRGLLWFYVHIRKLLKYASY
jgi:hypothetical protein